MKIMFVQIKKIGILIAFFLFALACKETMFDDYNHNAVYFPFQFPVRTISLGEDVIDNTGDREHKFKIGVVIGGLYENTHDRIVYFEVDESLVDNIATGNGDTIFALPQAYYTL